MTGLVVAVARFLAFNNYGMHCDNRLRSVTLYVSDAGALRADSAGRDAVVQALTTCEDSQRPRC